MFDFDLCVSKENGRNYYYLGFYELGTLHVMQMVLKPGDVFIDVGSSVGQMALYASSLVGTSGKVLAFEPHGGRYSDLCNGIAFNRRDNVLPFNLALGNAPGKARLFDKGTPRPHIPFEELLPGSRRNLTMIPGDGHTRSESVLVDTLDNVLAESNVARVRMLKVDVEGFEGPMLRGAKALLSGDDAPMLSVERGEKADDVFRYIQSVNDYVLFTLARTQKYPSRFKPFDQRHRIKRHDNVFCFLPIHLKELPQNAFV